ncbi:uncharacterized protein LOC118512529 [Anopheles stephensi]|uniref:Uncharacterized protein n=1 Tax=Anopheles stephensi TaxID=30069 RepID=A0A182Y9R4_ANOST|nr:uncharacterized protein LOC118512529 [Anopheles stephensi]XP_035912970.1 uncharacterized protein LOC118512529 [Anopheles stephensi]XP_035912971.1 uncharacterized protein LOC118512529 [Anopheles stephensi]
MSSTESSEGAEGSDTSKVPSVDSFRERVEKLRAKYQDILQEGFFRNLQHDWLHQQAAEPDLTQASDTSTLDCLSDASGSFIVLNGRKFPLEFFRDISPKVEETSPPKESVRKSSSVEQHELQELDDYSNPYVVPTPDRIAQRNARKSRFHTARSRGCQDVRQRLHVEELPFDEEMLGPTKSAKFQSRLATQLDAHYRNELTYRPRIRNFMRIDAIHNLRESGRRQFETYYRQEYIVGQTRKQNIENDCYQQLAARCTELREAVRTIRQERFSATMRVLDVVKPYFETSAQLEARLKELQTRMTSLWNQVVRLESIWVQRLKLQNFLYLIMPKEWRERNDWIHQDDEGQLESYPISISRRDTVNIRNIDDGNDIWAVKRFFEQQYLAKNKPVHEAFTSPAELLDGVAELNTNSMTLLSRLDLMNWVKSNAEMESEKVQRNFANQIQAIRRFIRDMDERRKFYERRTVELKQLFDELVQGPLQDAIHNVRNREIESLVTVVYSKLLPAKERDEGTSVRLSGVTCFAFIFEMVLQLLADFDQMPAALLHSIEHKVRFRRRRRMIQAVRAAEEEHRISQLAVQLRRGLATPYKKPDHKVKPPRSRLRRKEVPVVVEKPHVTKLEEIFRLAFGEDATMTPEERRNFEIDMIYQNYCSVQFDHFLRMIGYEPDYDVVSRVQQRDGPEENFFKRKELIPRVLRKLQQWQHMQQMLRERLFQRMSAELQTVRS